MKYFPTFLSLAIPFLLFSRASSSQKLNQNHVQTVLRVMHSLELELETNCAFINGLISWETAEQFLFNLDHNQQIFINFHNISIGTRNQISSILTKKPGLKYSTCCNFAVYNFDVDSHFDNLDDLERNYHIVLISGASSQLKRYVSALQTLRNVILLHTAEGSHGEYLDLDAVGALRSFESPDNVHFRSRWNFRGQPLCVVVPEGFSFWSKKLIAQYREGTSSEIFLSTSMVVTKAFNASMVINSWMEYFIFEQGHFTMWMPLSNGFTDKMIPSLGAGNDGLVFFTGLVKRVKGRNPVKFLIQALDPVIWTFKLGFLFVTVGLILVTELTNDGHRKGYTIPERLFSIFASVFRLFAQQNITHQLAKSLQRTKIKLMIGPWLLGLILLNSDLQTRLSSSLTTPKWVIPPKTFVQLSQSEYKINILGFEDSDSLPQGFVALLNGNTSLALRLDSKVARKFNFHQLTECLATTQFGEEVCMGSAVLGTMFARFSLITEYGQKLFQVSKDSLAPSTSVLYLSKKYPYLSGRLNFVVSSYFESGIFFKWLEGESFINIGRKAAKAKKLKEKPSTKKSRKGEGVSDEEAPFNTIFIVHIGGGTGFLVFLWEIRSRLVYYKMWLRTWVRCFWFKFHRVLCN